jgi:arylsulfatase A-like enzyme
VRGRRWRLFAALLLFLGSGALLSLAAVENKGPSTLDKQRNVLIVTIDTLRADQLGLYGNTTVKTPNLDRLGRSGTWFTTDIAQQPNTSASHTSIFTGVYPYVHGVRQHMLDRLSPDVQTLAELLDRRGYATAGFYSWVSSENGFSGLRGFQTHENLSIHLTPAVAGARFQYLGFIYQLLGKYLFLPGLIENQFLPRAQGSVLDNTDGKANVTTDAALRWIDAKGSKPFFLWVHYFDPHIPYAPPPPFDTMYDPHYAGSVDGGMQTAHYIYSHGTGVLTEAEVNHLRALYEGEVSFADQQMGRLLDEFDRLGLTANTIIVVTADHGESLGTAGRWFHGPRLNYTDIHVPLIIRFPPDIPANHSVDGPVESIDILPTILDLLDMPHPAHMQGTSLLPLIAGENQGNDRTALTMLDTYRQISWLNTRWHLIWDWQKNTAELYDYHTDPLELHNQAAQQPDVAAQLLRQLQQRLNDLRFPKQ